MENLTPQETLAVILIIPVIVYLFGRFFHKGISTKSFLETPAIKECPYCPPAQGQPVCCHKWEDN